MKVSVSIVTFQHHATARQAIESVLMQVTDFPVEIIVGDDASTDGTREIIEELRARAPDLLKPLLHEENFGDYGLSNLMSTLDAATGDYIAFLDGDDFWTDPRKLQKQADFLDAHPECALCAHTVEHRRADGARHLSPRPPGGHPLSDPGALVVRNFAPKVSTVIRASGLRALPEWYRSSTFTSNDWLLNVLVGSTGRVGFVDDVMAVHRIHETGITTTHGTQRMLEDKLRALAMLDEHLPDARRAIAKSRRRVRWKHRLARASPRLFALLKRMNGRTAHPKS